MQTFQDFLNQMDFIDQREILKEVLDWIKIKYPKLEEKVGWNQPMFTDHGTFIIAFSVSKKHFAVAPEKVTMDKFRDLIKKSGYEDSSMLFRIKWTDKVDYELLSKIIEFNIEDKKNHSKFWR